ncbi:carbohydrate ABC transporter membrane protein 2 (CUT1 family) [Micromonospora pisi]|uniref:Carbohydrate ABC transporter membrane protein 2 (CUT1 family) n=1 Tax=Micromonospora pisi TaxID=589240 RepID=A0A495JH39_9ACTN|nr:carbohydrate ABC transporter permease [Micromonospora pisi]RKR88203.1 carbohydrate ABC transporter membrane protein 2 (CUT1 family) [Micromonospora pisi]
MTTTATPRPATGRAGGGDRGATRRRPSGRRHYGTHLFLVAMAVLWLVPLLWTLYTALRPKEVTDRYGYWSLHGPLNLENFATAWTQGGMATYFGNSAIITIPSVLLTLALASMMAFAVSRFSWKFNLTLLIMFTAGNMLPPQVLAAPLFEMFKHTPLPYSISASGSLLDTYYAVIAVEVAFQLGFCTFVLANYMKALPGELTEAALVDGAGVWRQYSRIILPLCRPALAALGTLEVIWLYNDFFWPLLFIHSGDQLPITTGIKNLQGQFLLDYNLIAAGATITVIPTLIVYLALQRHFVAGLTLGANKG